jgi:hypothetical protein
MFKSPVAKLVKFFERSRDGWKAKCQTAKSRSKHWATQARAVERSRDAWRVKAESAVRELRQLKQELEALKSTAAG